MARKYKILVWECYKEAYLDYFSEAITHSSREFNCDYELMALTKHWLAFVWVVKQQLK